MKLKKNQFYKQPQIKQIVIKKKASNMKEKQIKRLL
jgi:hypothetical protein